jgi:hypothetical protein
MPSIEEFTNLLVDVINALVYSHFTSGPITIDHENVVKAYSASPSMLGRGHMLFEPRGPVWVRLWLLRMRLFPYFTAAFTTERQRVGLSPSASCGLF